MEQTGENIRFLMRRKRIKPFDLAVILGLQSTTSVYAWMQGRKIPNADNLLKLSYVFDCTIEEILVIEE